MNDKATNSAPPTASPDDAAKNDGGLASAIKFVETTVEANPVGGAIGAFAVGFVLARLFAPGARSHG